MMIGGAGWAVMAWRLAQLRARDFGSAIVFDEIAEREYYRIVDRATSDTERAARYAPGHCMTIKL